MWAVRETHHKAAVDLLQDGLLVQRHGLALPLLDPLLLQLLTRVHLPGGPHLARTHLGDIHSFISTPLHDKTRTKNQ